MIERNAIYSRENVKKYRQDGIEWDFHNEDTQQHLHSLHPYPARFIPQIPKKAILEWSKPGDVVFDPFCGSGTTILESILLDRPAIGVDNNAVACLISKAKTATYTHEDLRVLEHFVSYIEPLLEPDTLSGMLIPEYKNLEYWFDEQAIIDLGKLNWNIEQLSGNAKLLAKAVLSAIIVRVSYQDSDTRYARKEYEYVPGTAIKSYQTKLKAIIKRLVEIIDLPRANSEIYQMDGRDLSAIRDESVNLIVTSPPYLNAYDYHKYHRHRLHWIEGDVAFARDKEIGKHDTFTKPNAEPGPYFDDMNQCFIEWYRLLCPGGKVLIVIGDAIVSKKPVAVGDTFVELCRDIGFQLENRWIRKLQTSKKSFNQSARMDQEHLLLFSKK